MRGYTLFQYAMLLVVLSGCGLLSGSETPSGNTQLQGGTLEEAIASFQDSVYPVVRRDCIGCHDSGIGPQFAVASVFNAYDVSRRYVSFQNVPQSRLVIKSQDGHCGSALCLTDGVEMTTAVTQWWENGEGALGTNSTLGGVTTYEQILPEPLPTGNTWALMQWDLGSIGGPFEGAVLGIDVQEFNESTYRFRNPRLITGDQTIFIEDLKVLINGDYDPRDNAYTIVSDTLPPFTNNLLSTDVMIVLKDRGVGDAISINIQDLEVLP